MKSAIRVYSQKRALLDPVLSMISPDVAPPIGQDLGKVTYLKVRTEHEATPLDKAAKYEMALRLLARELASARERERHKIADQIHDGMGQDILVAKFKLGQLAEELPLQYRDAIHDINEIIDVVIRETRGMIQDLYPQQLFELGLPSALQSLATEMQSKYRLICTTKLESPSKPLHEDVQLVIFAAVRELLVNVVKHAQASTAKVTMKCRPGFIVVEVCDNGRGFNPDRLPLSDVSTGHFGLFSLRSRLVPLGGSLRMVSRLGKGTKAILTVSLKNRG
jgi:signal transduction histidine kinase